MFRAILDFFRKTCKDCEHYSYYREPDKLLPDKTVVRGKLVCESCEKMNCRLTDLEPCKMFKDRSRTHNGSHALRIQIGGLSKPPKGGSGVPIKP